MNIFIEVKKVHCAHYRLSCFHSLHCTGDQPSDLPLFSNETKANGLREKNIKNLLK